MVEPTRRWFGIGSAALAAMVYGRRADGEPMPATIVVDRQTLPIDSPVAIELRGFPPGRPVTLTATETFPSGSRWQARAILSPTRAGVSMSRIRRRSVAATTACRRWAILVDGAAAGRSFA